MSRLERKYKTDCAGLLQLQLAAEKEMQLLENPQNIVTLKKTLESKKQILVEHAQRLRQSRERAALKLSAEVEKELSDLSMASAKLLVTVEGLVEYTSNGSERVEILIAANAGEQFKPLREVASGGELARITLVLKKTLRDRTGVNVLVFDEVDTGVSGKVARAMGEKLLVLAQESSQVLCVTHLAQVASLAHHHFLVSKKEQGGRTISEIKLLEREDRIDEVARMLSGHKITESARASARELMSL